MDRLRNLLMECFTREEFTREVVRGLDSECERAVDGEHELQWFDNILRYFERRGQMFELANAALRVRPLREDQLREAFGLSCGSSPSGTSGSWMDEHFDDRQALRDAPDALEVVRRLGLMLRRRRQRPFGEGDPATSLVAVAVDRIAALAGRSEDMARLLDLTPDEAGPMIALGLRTQTQVDTLWPVERRFEALREMAGDAWPDLVLVLAQTSGSPAPLLYRALDVKAEGQRLADGERQRIAQALAVRAVVEAAWTEDDPVWTVTRNAHRPLLGQDHALRGEVNDVRAVRTWRAGRRPEEPERADRAQDLRRLGFLAALDGDWAAASERYREAAERSTSEHEDPTLTWLTWEAAAMARGVEHIIGVDDAQRRNLSAAQQEVERRHPSAIARVRDLEHALAAGEADLHLASLTGSRDARSSDVLRKAARWVDGVERWWLLPYQAGRAVRARAFAVWVESGEIQVPELIRYGSDDAARLLDETRRAGSDILLDPAGAGLLEDHVHLGAWLAAAHVLEGKLDRAEPVHGERLAAWAEQLRDRMTQQAGAPIRCNSGAETHAGGWAVAARLCWRGVARGRWSDVQGIVDRWLTDQNPHLRESFIRQLLGWNVHRSVRAGLVTKDEAASLLGRGMVLALGMSTVPVGALRTAGERIGELGRHVPPELLRRLAEQPAAGRRSDDEVDRLHLLGEGDRVARLVEEAASRLGAPRFSSEDLSCLVHHASGLPASLAGQVVKAVRPLVAESKDGWLLREGLWVLVELAAHPDLAIASEALRVLADGVRRDARLAWIVGTQGIVRCAADRGALWQAMHDAVGDPAAWRSVSAAERASTLLTLASMERVPYPETGLRHLWGQLHDADARVGWLTLRTLAHLAKRPDAAGCANLVEVARRDERPLLQAGCRIWLDADAPYV